MKRYTFDTWLIANLLHPIILVFYLGVNETSGVEIISSLLCIFILSLFFSLPSLVFGFFAVSLIRHAPIDAVTKFIAWLLAAAGIAFVNSLLLTKDDRELIAVVGASSGLSVVGAIMLQVRYFFKTLDKAEQATNENNKLDDQTN